MNKFYEAVSVTEALPEINEKVYAIAEREFKSSPTTITAWWDGKSWYSTQANEDEIITVTHWLRPLPVPEGTLTDDQIGDAADDYAKDGDEAGAGAAGFESGAMWVNKKYLPLIASQQAEIERFKKQELFSPIEKEKNWQIEMLKKLYPNYPHEMFHWQYLNSLLSIAIEAKNNWAEIERLKERNRELSDRVEQLIGEATMKDLTIESLRENKQQF